MRATIAGRREVAEDTLEVDFDLQGGKISFQPGEFFNIDLIDPPYDDERGAHRHFSIANSPNREGVISMLTRVRDTAFKRSLRDMPLGSEVEIGDTGGKDFTLPDDTSRPLVFIAGGIGIAPFIGMIRYVIEEGLDYDITLIYSNRSRDSAAFLEELEKHASENENVHLILTMTDDPEWSGESRRIDAAFVEDHIDDPASRTFMIAGPPGMNKEVAAELEKAGVDESHVKASNFSGY